MALRSTRLVIVLGALLLCFGAAGCSSQGETDVEKLEHSTANNETLNQEIASILIGTPIAAVRAKLGKSEHYESVQSGNFGKTEYLNYGQWRLNFTDGTLVAIYKYKP